MDVTISYHGRNTYTDVGAPNDYKGLAFAYVTRVLATRAKYAPAALWHVSVDQGWPVHNIWT